MSIRIRAKDEETVKEILNFILNKYLNKLEEISYQSLSKSSKTFHELLLELNDHERKTYRAVVQLGRATAKDVASITKRARAVESNYLNRLMEKGYLEKETRGRRVFFRIPEKYQSILQEV